MMKRISIRISICEQNQRSKFENKKSRPPEKNGNLTKNKFHYRTAKVKLILIIKKYLTDYFKKLN